RGSLREYNTLLLLAYLVLGFSVFTRAVTIWALLALLSAPRAWMLTRQVAANRGRALNKSLADTGQLVLLFGVLYSLGLVISRLVQ
ncbi:MAG TPA: 1,4-dihydroxy-2-naphthoate polyprenyltransferase, partial [Bellilinea sp.]|nr:1,4-dihydroxy-2-naphthoate polyprenyltransferase [Bellilinea sp.]